MSLFSRFPKFKRPSIALLIVLAGSITLLALQMRLMNAPAPVPEIPYSAFMSRLDKGEFAEVEIAPLSRAVVATLVTPDKSGVLPARYVRSFLPVTNSEYVLQRVEHAGVSVKSGSSEPSLWDNISSWFPILLFIIFLTYLVRTTNPSSRLTSMLGSSRARLITEVPSVKFSDVAGADEAKQELSEMVDFLKDPLAMTGLGGRLPKGALLIGPPGTGKTLLARAVAGEAGRPFYSMSGSDFVEMFVGVGAARVRGVFEAARKNAPCIVFIDEIDAVGRARGSGTGGGNDEREQTLNQLLVEMDGFEPAVGIVVLAATNRPDVLDAALLRPGRFDRQVNVDLPDTAGRLAILKVHAAKIKMAPSVDLLRLARGCPGMSGADLANLLNEAAVLAARRGHADVMPEDLESSKDKLILGLERKSMILSPFERSLTAFHEAGHAVVALATKGSDPLHKVTIIPRGRALGVTATIPDIDRHMYTRRWLMEHIVMLFGGRAAEQLVYGEHEITTGAQSDIQRATEVARDMVASFGMTTSMGMMNIPDPAPGRAGASQATLDGVDQEIRSILSNCYEAALDILTLHRTSLDTLTYALLDRDTLSREEILALLPDMAALPHHLRQEPIHPPPPSPVVA